MTQTASPRPHPDRVRDRRLAGPRRRRVHLRERAPLCRRRGALVVERGDQAKGVVIAYDRRFASEHFARAAAEVLLAHDIPVAISRTAVPTQMSSYEVVQRGAAAGIVITASHNPWTDNGFKVKSPTGAAAGADMLPTIEAGIDANAGTSIERRPLEDAEAAGLVEWFDPFEGYQRFVGRTLDLDALRGRGRVRPRRAAVRRRFGLDPAPPRGWPDPGHRGPQRAQPVLRRRQPRADPAQRRRGAGADRGRRLRPGPAARRRRRPGGRRRRARHVPPPAGGHGPAHVLPGGVPRDARPGRRVRQQHLDGVHARAALRDRDPRGPGGLQVHRSQDDRDRRDAGRRGVGRLRLRDAPPRARRHLRGPVPAGPVPARARARPRAGVGGDGGVPRARRPVVLPPDRRPLRPALVRRASSSACSSACASRRRPPSRARSIERTQWLDTGDGVKWFLADGSWLLVRASGTEPLVRVYTEATTPELRDELVVAGERLVRGG